MRSSLEIPGAVESGDEDPSGVLFRLQSGRAPGEVLSGGKRLPSAGDPGPVVWALKVPTSKCGPMTGISTFSAMQRTDFVVVPGSLSPRFIVEWPFSWK
jgi:hypothetical protein